MPDLTPEVLAAMATVAGKVARRAHRKVRRTEREELEQVAWAALLKAWRKGTFDPDLGDLSGWCWRVAANAVSREVIVSGSPVTSSQNGSRARAVNACDQQRVDALDTPLPDPEPLPEEALREARWRATVQARVEALVGEGGAAFVFAVVTREWTPEEIATYHSQPVQSVYALRTKATRRLAGDPELFKLWKDQP